MPLCFLHIHRMYHTSVNPWGNCGLWAIMMSQYVGASFIKVVFHKSECGVDNKGGYIYRWGVIWVHKKNVPPSQFCCKPKAALKSCLKKIRRKSQVFHEDLIVFSP